MQHKPQMMVCYLCGQQFGTTSLSIHQPQCYQKQLTWWKQNDPATRGPKPKDPAIVGHKSQDKMGAKDIEKFNEEQYKDFSQNLAPCENCGRKFLPDRLVVHLRSCRPNGSSGVGKSPPMNPQNPQQHRSPGAKPQMLVCYLCGQQYGTKSLSIHQPQCYSKKLAQWQDGDPQTRGPKPRDPKDNPDGPPEGMSREEWNNQQFDDHNKQLSKCPHCSRTFLPDRLQVHLRSCGGGGGGGAEKVTPPRQGKPQGARPQMLVCYLCGQQFGTTSLSIHQPQCYTKQLLWWERADPATRGPKPKDPSTLPPGSQPTPGNAQEFNDQQFKNYNENLSPCPNCGRTFLADRLVVHMRSCNPEASGKGSKPVGATSNNNHTPPGGYQKQPSRAPSEANHASPTSQTRSPLVNRLPTQKDPGRPCPQCKTIEHDPEAKFCQECGSNLHVPCAEPAKKLVCQSCNEEWDSGKFCQSCGGALAEVVEPEPQPPAQMCCSHCGVAITSKFCQECGTPNRSPLVNRLSSPQVVPPIQPPPTYQESVQQHPQPPQSSSPPRSNSSVPSPVSGERKWMTESTAPKELPEVPEFNDDDATELQPCSNCGRKFLPDRLEKHARVCTSQKTRKVFKQSLAGDEAASLKRASSPAPVVKKEKKDWKAASKSFREAMRSAREVDTAIKEGKALPPPTYTKEEDDTRVQCPHCSRKFAEDVAARHIPKCATTVNRPNAPKVAKATRTRDVTPDASPKNRRPSALLSTITSTSSHNTTLGSPVPEVRRGRGRETHSKMRDNGKSPKCSQSCKGNTDSRCNPRRFSKEQAPVSSSFYNHQHQQPQHHFGFTST
eukprot:TRINITY_DN2274_c1_g1_i1.p1 TRINITY_DN2274_c1_g1~~TRINITY_DN2274_c1_g1_i1.p1  ORF type:complete len:832 (+),score=119.26 TRINITY_DN2274_c1_g1_i1:96-2591(+)